MTGRTYEERVRLAKKLNQTSIQERMSQLKSVIIYEMAKCFGRA